MLEKSPETYGIITYLWVLILGAWGGITSYLGRTKAGYIEKFSLVELIGEVCISAFAGLMAFYLCELGGFPQVATAAIVGISGHMGGKAISLLEQRLKSRFSVYLKRKNDDE